MTSPLPQGTQVKDLDPDTFYTPEQIAPVIGIKPTPLRAFCRQSGINTRLSKNSMHLTLENVKALHAWIVKHNAPDKTAADFNAFK